VPHWTETFFGHLYGEIYRRHILTGARTRQEVDFVRSTLDLRGKRVLDLAAGFGRHARPIARTNRVFAVDANRDYLRMAVRGLRGAARKNLHAARADMRHLPIADASMDAALLLFNSFGYFVDATAQPDPVNARDSLWRLPSVFYQRHLVDEHAQTVPPSVGKAAAAVPEVVPDGNLAVLEEVARVLAPGGDLLVEVPNPAVLVRAVVAAPRRRSVTADYEIEEEYAYDSVRRVLTNRTVFRAGKRHESAGYALRLYAQAELRAALRGASLRHMRSYGGYDGTPFVTRSSEMLLVHAQKQRTARDNNALEL
jgi:SAM-dependent methyltransferase